MADAIGGSHRQEEERLGGREVPWCRELAPGASVARYRRRVSLKTGCQDSLRTLSLMLAHQGYRSTPIRRSIHATAAKRLTFDARGLSMPSELRQGLSAQRLRLAELVDLFEEDLALNAHIGRPLTVAVRRICAYWSAACAETRLSCRWAATCLHAQR